MRLIRFLSKQHPEPNLEALIPAKRRPRGRFSREPEIRHNRFIRVREVKLIGDDGQMIGVMQTRDALKRAQDLGLDLVEISPNSVPPVCRITDFGRYKYDLDKKKKEAKKKQAVVKVKEVKYHANVEDHDYETKLRRMREFIEDNNRVKCTLWFRGRENSHHEIGFELFKRIEEDVSDIAHAEQPAKLAGRSLGMLLSPGKKKKK